MPPAPPGKPLPHQQVAQLLLLQRRPLPLTRQLRHPQPVVDRVRAVGPAAAAAAAATADPDAMTTAPTTRMSATTATAVLATAAASAMSAPEPA